MSASIAHFNAITHLYDQHRALDRVDFALPREGVVGLLGLNGAGKTTTMNLLCGVLVPSEGQVFIDGHSMKLFPRKCKALIGYAPDRPPLYPGCTVREYLCYAAAQRRIPRKARAQAVTRAMQSTDIDDYANKLCGHLSHGYRQRLNLAQAIVHSPPLIVLDEPTSGLDPAQIGSVRSLIRELSRNSCVLISTHLLFEAQQLCQRVLIVHAGQVIEDRATETADSQPPRYLLQFNGKTTDGAGGPDYSVILRDCPAITDVQAEDGLAFSVQLAWPDEPGQARRELLNFIVGHDLDLTEIREEHDSLEKRFLALTSAPLPPSPASAAVESGLGGAPGKPEPEQEAADETAVETDPDGAEQSGAIEDEADPPATVQDSAGSDRVERESSQENTDRDAADRLQKADRNNQESA